jgi:hypothetical protein
VQFSGSRKGFSHRVSRDLGIPSGIEHHGRLDAFVPHELLKNWRHHAGRPTKPERPSKIAGRRVFELRTAFDNLHACLFTELDDDAENGVATPWHPDENHFSDSSGTLS